MVATSTQTRVCGAQGLTSEAERITPSSQGAFTNVAMVVRFPFLESVSPFTGGPRTDARVFPTLQYIGIDVWAWCKGQSYGMILVNLETHTMIDLLPERTMESVLLL